MYLPKIKVQKKRKTRKKINREKKDGFFFKLRRRGKESREHTNLGGRLKKENNQQNCRYNIKQQPERKRRERERGEGERKPKEE